MGGDRSAIDLIKKAGPTGDVVGTTRHQAYYYSRAEYGEETGLAHRRPLRAFAIDEADRGWRGIPWCA